MDHPASEPDKGLGSGIATF